MFRCTLARDSGKMRFVKFGCAVAGVLSLVTRRLPLFELRFSEKWGESDPGKSLSTRVPAAVKTRETRASDSELEYSESESEARYRYYYYY